MSPADAESNRSGACAISNARCRLISCVHLLFRMFSSTECRPHQRHSEAGAADIPAFLSGQRADRHGHEPGDGLPLYQLWWVRGHRCSYPVLFFTNMRRICIKWRWWTLFQFKCTVAESAIRSWKAEQVAQKTMEMDEMDAQKLNFNLVMAQLQLAVVCLTFAYYYPAYSNNAVPKHSAIKILK